jgi:hypothetical protein
MCTTDLFAHHLAEALSQSCLLIGWFLRMRTTDLFEHHLVEALAQSGLLYNCFDWLVSAHAH